MKKVMLGEYEYLAFNDECELVLPLKGHGSIKVVGWDIPMQWAVDSANNLYGSFDAHGGYLKPTTREELFKEMRDEGDYGGEQTVRSLLGLKKSPNHWMREAKKAGWTPPANFKEDAYDWE
jgi:hypothetical protein